MTLIEEAYGYLGDTTTSYLATSLDDQPYVRAMMLIKKNDRFYYATGSTDGKNEQLIKNPKVEICVLLGEAENGGSLRIRGKADYISNEDTRAEVHECVGFIQSFWPNPQDPAWGLIEIKPESIELMRPGTMDIERSDI